MCGRYYLRHSPREIREGLGPDWDWRFPEFPTLGLFNMAPSQEFPVACDVAGEKAIIARQWGLAPSWLKDPSKAQINARAETVWEKPMFRHGVHKGRCLVPASGWYEWQQSANGKQPHALAPLDDSLLLFAGIEDNGTYAILTREATPALAHVHHRMPCVLSRDAAMAWMSPHDDEAAEALAMRVLGTFKAWPVSTQVNSPRNDDPSNIKPID
ncbi:MAG: SOS response-associated peptidase [Gammaproteobacteria bacterium]|nr:SOS response-associated peptidase [Gammaproteobacteria bacterium]